MLVNLDSHSALSFLSLLVNSSKLFKRGQKRSVNKYSVYTLGQCRRRASLFFVVVTVGTVSLPVPVKST